MISDSQIRVPASILRVHRLGPSAPRVLLPFVRAGYDRLPRNIAYVLSISVCPFTLFSFFSYLLYRELSYQFGYLLLGGVPPGCRRHSGFIWCEKKLGVYLSCELYSTCTFKGEMKKGKMKEKGGEMEEKVGPE